MQTPVPTIRWHRRRNIRTFSLMSPLVAIDESQGETNPPLKNTVAG